MDLVAQHHLSKIWTTTAPDDQNALHKSPGHSVLIYISPPMSNYPHFITIIHSIHYFSQYFEQVLPSCFSCRKTCKKGCRPNLVNHSQQIVCYRLEIRWGSTHSVQEFISNIFEYYIIYHNRVFQWSCCETQIFAFTFPHGYLNFIQHHHHLQLFRFEKHIIWILCNSPILMSQFWFAYFTIIHRYLPQRVVQSTLSTIYIRVRQLFRVLIFGYTDRCSSLSGS